MKFFEKINKRLEELDINPPVYVIAVYEDSYCMTRRIGESIDVVLSKSISNEDELNTEVKNLSKYFNAKIYYY